MKIMVNKIGTFGIRNKILGAVIVSSPQLLLRKPSEFVEVSVFLEPLLSSSFFTLYSCFFPWLFSGCFSLGGYWFGWWNNPETFAALSWNICFKCWKDSEKENQCTCWFWHLKRTYPSCNQEIPRTSGVRRSRKFNSTVCFD